MQKLTVVIAFAALAACRPSPGPHVPNSTLAAEQGGGGRWGQVDVVQAADGRIAQVVTDQMETEIRVDGVVVVAGAGRPGRPVFSPDGRELAFVSGVTGVASVWLLDLQTGARRQLTNRGLKPGAGLAASFVPPPVRVGSTLWTDGGLLIWDAGDSVWACDSAADQSCRRVLATSARPTSASGGAVTLRDAHGVGRRVLLGT